MTPAAEGTREMPVDRMAIARGIFVQKMLKVFGVALAVCAWPIFCQLGLKFGFFYLVNPIGGRTSIESYAFTSVIAFVIEITLALVAAAIYGVCDHFWTRSKEEAGIK